MPSHLKVKATYDDDHVEEFTIHTDLTTEWASKPGTMKLHQRTEFDRILLEMRELMVGASIRKLEIEEELADA